MIMTTSPLLFGRVIKISIEASGGKLNFNNDDLEIHFEVPFDDDAKPNISTVQIYNLTKTTINRIKKGANITVSAGYKSDYGVLTSGKVTKVLTNMKESTSVRPSLSRKVSTIVALRLHQM